MQALLHNTQESYLTSSDSDNLTELNTEEADILNDDIGSKTSEQLFARVRQDAIDLYDSRNSVNHAEE